MLIQKTEVELVGQWRLIDGKMQENEVNKRIDWLIENHLQRLASDDSGWEVLYQDPTDNRLWELTFPMGEMQGGGPKSLKNISPLQAKEKYSI